jgi:hypothetical protein
MRFLGFFNHEKWAVRQEISKWSTVCTTFTISGWSVVRSASLAKGGTSKQRSSPHLHKIPTRSNKVSPRTFQTALVFDEEHKLWRFSLCNTIPFSFITSFPLGPNVLVSNLFSDTRQLYSFLDVRDQDSHPSEIPSACFNLQVHKIMYNLLLYVSVYRVTVSSDWHQTHMKCSPVWTLDNSF